ncbi:hypothetical protein EVAR_84033_1 [Eumeta japonica]|uniref:Uncharacterized protein n=1 Tax=Eumeta variegata TaxID=151549 RepID=A0A4C1X528_EUMVA|nr:hypothetical protein EVAR_84033_1 [Eumeta japonica]
MTTIVSDPRFAKALEHRIIQKRISSVACHSTRSKEASDPNRREEIGSSAGCAGLPAVEMPSSTYGINLVHRPGIQLRIYGVKRACRLPGIESVVLTLNFKILREAPHRALIRIRVRAPDRSPRNKPCRIYIAGRARARARARAAYRFGSIEDTSRTTMAAVRCGVVIKNGRLLINEKTIRPPSREIFYFHEIGENGIPAVVDARAFNGDALCRGRKSTSVLANLSRQGVPFAHRKYRVAGSGSLSIGYWLHENAGRSLPTAIALPTPVREHRPWACFGVTLTNVFGRSDVRTARGRNHRECLGPINSRDTPARRQYRYELPPELPANASRRADIARVPLSVRARIAIRIISYAQTRFVTLLFDDSKANETFLKVAIVTILRHARSTIDNKVLVPSLQHDTESWLWKKRHGERDRYSGDVIPASLTFFAGLCQRNDLIEVKSSSTRFGGVMHQIAYHVTAVKCGVLKTRQAARAGRGARHRPAPAAAGVKPDFYKLANKSKLN